MSQESVAGLVTVLHTIVKALSERALAFLALLLTFVVFIGAGIGETNWIRYALACTWAVAVFIPVVMLVFRKPKPQVQAQAQE